MPNRNEAGACCPPSNKKGKIELCGDCHYHQAVYPTGKCYVEPKVNDRHQSEIACRHFKPKELRRCRECRES